MNRSLLFGWITAIKREPQTRWYFAGTLLILLSILFWLTPYTGDDFTFKAFARNIHGVSSYIQAMGYMYQHVNGRVVGNGLELLLANHRFLSSIVESGTVVSILVLSTRLVRVTSLAGRTALIGAILFLPATIFSQTYAWRAGFFNYVTALVIVLLILLFVTRNDGQQKRGVVLSLVMFVLAVIGCLFTENITAMLVLLSVFLIVYSLWCYRSVSWDRIGLLLGTLLGAAIMFSSPVYWAIARGGDSYRSVAGGSSDGLMSTIFSNLNDIATLLITHNIALFLALSVVCLGLLFKKKDILGQVKLRDKLLVFALSFMPVYFFVSANFAHASKSVILSDILALLHITSALIFVGAVILTVILFLDDRKLRDKILLYLAMALTSVAPFIAIRPFGPRDFYFSYVLLLLAATMIALHTLSGVKISKNMYSIMDFATLSAVLFSAVLFFGMFYSIHSIETKNDHLAITQIRSGSGNVRLLEYPFNSYLHDTRSGNKTERFYGNCYCQYVKCTSCDHIRITYH